jgi:hypothetical protein
MNRNLKTIGLFAIASLFILGLFTFGHELKKSSDLKSHREHIRFQRDSLQLEIYKKQLNNESNNSSK